MWNRWQTATFFGSIFADALLHDLFGRSPETGTLTYQREPAIEKLHAALDVAAMVAAKPEHARSHARS